MDRNAPENLLEGTDKALEDLENLLLSVKEKDKVKPSITVRFAPTSTPELLKGAGSLAKKYPQALIQTHLSESPEEIKWVKKLFPQYSNYAEVYNQNGLLTERTLLGHCIHLEDDEIKVLKNCKSHLVHCPSSNPFFLGSGVFPYRKLAEKNLSIAMGSDVGAGWSLSLQSVARCAYGAQALQKTFLKSSELLYLITRAGALALGEKNRLGLLEKNYEADLWFTNLKKEVLLGILITVNRQKNFYLSSSF